MGPTGHLPKADGDCYVDIFHITIPGILTGNKTILGMAVPAFKFRKTISICKKSDAPAAIGIPVTASPRQ